MKFIFLLSIQLFFLSINLFAQSGYTVDLLKMINASDDADPAPGVVLNNTLYFPANDGVNGIELWRTDGTSNGTFLVKDINPNGNSNPRQMVILNSKIYFWCLTATFGT